MGQTLAEKLIARAAGKDTVRPGETVTVTIDLAMMHDSSGPRRIAPILEQLGAKVWDPAKIVLISDHWVPGRRPAKRIHSRHHPALGKREQHQGIHPLK